MSITRCTHYFTTIWVYKRPDHQCWLALPTSLNLRCTTLQIPHNSASPVCLSCLPSSVMKKHDKNSLGMCLSGIYKIFFSGGSRLEIRWYLQRFKRPLGPGGRLAVPTWPCGNRWPEPTTDSKLLCSLCSRDLCSCWSTAGHRPFVIWSFPDLMPSYYWGWMCP